MMEAQRAALEEKKAVQETEQKQAAKTGFGGFKKGFFGEKPKKTTASKPEAVKTEKTEIVEVKKSSASAAAKNAPKPNREQIVEEVQRAMEEDQNPLLKQLRSNEWATQDLMSMVSTNSVLSQGLKNPRCVAAMELLQRDPKEAQKRYQGDPEVGQFLTEFCKVMSIHFTALGEQQAKASSTEEAPMEESEEEKVQRILADPEIRTLLMDPALQQILMECGDPVKLRKHMQNPETFRKIRKLSEAGLVKLEN
eukprot:gene9712-6950_t